MIEIGHYIVEGKKPNKILADSGIKGLELMIQNYEGADTFVSIIYSGTTYIKGIFRVWEGLKKGGFKATLDAIEIKLRMKYTETLKFVIFKNRLKEVLVLEGI